VPGAGQGQEREAAAGGLLGQPARSALRESAEQHAGRWLAGEVWAGEGGMVGN